MLAFIALLLVWNVIPLRQSQDAAYVFAQTPDTTGEPDEAAPDDVANETPREGASNGLMTPWQLFLAGKWVGMILLLVSVAATALVIEHFMTIRRTRLVPLDLGTELQDLVAKKEYEGARTAAAEHPSLLGRVVEAGLGRMGGLFGWFDIQTAMQEAAEAEVSRLYRKLEYLTFIAAAAPMLGLLGTVTGMIASFNQIAASEGSAPPSALAGGIAQALVTTCEGLIIAIPAMFFVGFFRNRVDSLMAEAGAVCDKVMAPLRHGQLE